MQFTLSEAIYYYEQNVPKGEYVLVIEGRNMADLEQESRDAWALKPLTHKALNNTIKDFFIIYSFSNTLQM